MAVFLKSTLSGISCGRHRREPSDLEGLPDAIGDPYEPGRSHEARDAPAGDGPIDHNQIIEDIRSAFDAELIDSEHKE